jgi:hypothetical protein
MSEAQWWAERIATGNSDPQLTQLASLTLTEAASSPSAPKRFRPDIRIDVEGLGFGFRSNAIDAEDIVGWRLHRFWDVDTDPDESSRPRLLEGVRTGAGVLILVSVVCVVGMWGWG